MKLTELMEAKVTRRLLGNIPVIKRTDSTLPIDFSKLKHLGTGVEADVYSAKKPGTALKVLRFPESFDLKGVQNNPFLHYISLCIRNQSNPFFPKVKSAKVYEIPHAIHNEEDEVPDERQYHATGDYVLIVVMEELKALDDVSLDEAEEAFNKIGVTMDTDKAHNDQKYRGDAALLPIRSMALTRGFDNNLKKLMANNTNKQLLLALKRLKPLFRKFGSDTHTGNFMFREGGEELQIVFTDPLYPEEDI